LRCWRGDKSSDLGNLSPPDQKGGIDFQTALGIHGHHLAPRSPGQLSQLAQLFLEQFRRTSGQ
jgi:hypothetical protein